MTADMETAIAVRCPVCKMPAGVACVRPNSTAVDCKLAFPHHDRFEAAEELIKADITKAMDDTA